MPKVAQVTQVSKAGQMSHSAEMRTLGTCPTAQAPLSLPTAHLLRGYRILWSLPLGPSQGPPRDHSGRVLGCAFYRWGKTRLRVPWAFPFASSWWPEWGWAMIPEGLGKVLWKQSSRTHASFQGVWGPLLLGPSEEAGVQQTLLLSPGPPPNPVRSLSSLLIYQEGGGSLTCLRSHA